MRRGFHFLGQEQFDQGEETLVELGRCNGFARDLDHRVVRGADRHRYRAQHANTETGRVVGFLQRVLVLQGVGEHGGMVLRRAVFGADHAETDFHVVFAGLLEALVPTDQLRIAAGDDIALAQQGSTSRFTGGRIGHRIVAGKRSGIIEVLMLVDGGFLRRTTGSSSQHQGQPDNPHGN
ncbi:hypothetical protein D3C76_1127770 [compost metagenome]